MLKPSEIPAILDLARRARKLGHIFNPLFVSPPGIGKSSLIQQWANANNLPFIDLRLAYLEAPDMIGYPSIGTINGRQVTTHNLPEFWPTEGEGVLLLEEPNRGTPSTMNTMMQLLTDRKIHKYTLPPGWIIVAAVNPEDEHHDVNTMDAALKDRFEIFNVVYDKPSFVKHIKESKWDKDLVMFIESSTWTYKTPDEIARSPHAKYVSPRTQSKLNAALKAGIPEELEISLYESIVGRSVGKDFYTFKHKERPILYSDIVANPKRALKELKAYGDPTNCKAGHISLTVRDIVDCNEITDELLADVILALPADQGPALLQSLGFKRKDEKLYDRIFKDFPEVKKYLKNIA
jgi:hypothetical protein